MYLGLDLSLTATGICILGENNKIVLLNTIETESKPYITIQDRWYRYKYILQQIIEYIRPFSFSGVAIENYSLASRGKIVQLVELGTLVRDYIIGPDIFILEPTPTQVKKYLLGKVQKGAKNIMCREVYKKYKIDIDDDNQVDAFILAMIARGYDLYLRNKEKFMNLFIYQQEVIKAIHKKINK